MATRKKLSKMRRKTIRRKLKRTKSKSKKGGCFANLFKSASINNDTVPLLGRLQGTPSRYIGAPEGNRSR